MYIAVILKGYILEIQQYIFMILDLVLKINSELC